VSVVTFEGNEPVGFYQKITGSSVTDITDLVTGTAPIFVARMSVGETAGAASTLTVEVYDGTNSFYLTSTDGTCWNAKAVTAKQGVRFFDGFVIPPGSKVRVTSSSGSGGFDVEGMKLLDT
jgi:hypothetical protein